MINMASSLFTSDDNVNNVASFYERLFRRYQECPAFFAGSLADACQAAFNLNVIEEVRYLISFVCDK